MKKLLKVILLLLISVCSTAGIYAQRTVTGTVLDDNQQPVPSANVVLKGTQIGALTDSNGKFTINVPSTGGSLLISFIGFVTQEIPIGTSSVINVTLQTESLALNEVVVVGYGTQKREEVTGAISSVTSEKINALPVASLDQALQGRAAGLTVISNGAPGQGATMRVRGISTVNDANPLFVVDGVVTTGINSLNAADIESIEVLKDASTAAIYGSLGSNGVIMVTTKKGKAGKVTVDFDGYYGVQYSNKRYDLLDAEQYREYATGGAFTTPTVYTNPIYADRLAGKNPSRPEGGETDWQDEIYQNGPMQNYDLALSGGTENTTFRLSTGYLNQRGIVIYTGYERYNFRANSEFKKGRLKIGENISVANGKVDPLADNGGRSLLEHAIKMAPYLPVYNENNLGGYQGPRTSIDGQDAENPVRIMELNSRKLNSVTIVGNLYGELDLIKGLKFRTNVGLDGSSQRLENFSPTFNDDDLGGSTHQATFATIAKNQSNYTALIFTNSLNYGLTLAAKHNFEVLALTEYSDVHSALLNAQSTNDITNEIQELSTSNASLSS